MDPFLFHQLMDAEKAAAQEKAQEIVSETVWSEISYPTWHMSSRSSRKKAAKSRRVAIATWKRAQGQSRTSVRIINN